MSNALPLGICTGPENGTIVAQAGADFLEANVQNFLVPSDGDESFAPHQAAASRAGLPIPCANCFLPAALPCVGPAVDETALLAYAGRAFARAQAVGMTTIVFGSGGSRHIPEGFPTARAHEQFADLLQKLAPLAAQSGVTLVVEPLHAKECNFINTLAQGAEFVEACGHPNVQLLADVYHMGFSNEGPDEIRRFGKLLRHVHVAEYPSRRFPGADGSSLTGYFEALREVGYQGRISMECHWRDLTQEAGLAVENARRDLAAAAYGRK